MRALGITLALGVVAVACSSTPPTPEDPPAPVPDGPPAASTGRPRELKTTHAVLAIAAPLLSRHAVA